ncbi:hypothetical protein [Kitasatospora sp. NPDC057223]|uniref:hypothetical protein n=1 Tax=Kitasatospora sp. NPDC057223 TaxID=3346055 RepID=UPI003633993A
MTGPEEAGLLVALIAVSGAVLAWCARGVQRVEADALEADIRARAEQLTAHAEHLTRADAIASGLIRGDDQP